MGASDLAYRTRPNKHIDREIFANLLELTVPILGPKKYVYISMGGAHLVDHVMVYRRLGIENLFSFDNDANIINRQKFNRPLSSMVCKHMESSHIAVNLENIIDGFDNASNVIIWLDFTSPNERHHQLTQVNQIASKLCHGDLLRVTLNANTQTLNEDQSNDLEWHEKGEQSPIKYSNKRLKDTLKEFVPSSVSITAENDFASALVNCIRSAILQGLETKQTVKAIPVLNTTYKDGQRMVTAAYLFLDNDKPLPPSVENWEHTPKGDNSLIRIEAPNLSIKEKITIDERINNSASKIVDSLDFCLEKNKDRFISAIESYKKIQRHYPYFHNIDI